MQTSEQGLALIKKFEAFSAEPYYCPAGKRTIGYGHVIGNGIFPISGITPQQAHTLLLGDVKPIEKALVRLVTRPLTQSQHDALVSLVLNIGLDAFQKSTLLRELNARDDAAAAAQFGRWVYCNGKVLEGLVRRRAAETALFNVTKT